MAAGPALGSVTVNSIRAEEPAAIDGMASDGKTARSSLFSTRHRADIDTGTFSSLTEPLLRTVTPIRVGTPTRAHLSTSSIFSIVKLELTSRP